jgi:hypothetical protein
MPPGFADGIDNGGASYANVMVAKSGGGCRSLDAGTLCGAAATYAHYRLREDGLSISTGGSFLHRLHHCVISPLHIGPRPRCPLYRKSQRRKNRRQGRQTGRKQRRPKDDDSLNWF